MSDRVPDPTASLTADLGDQVSWASFLSTVRVGGRLPITFRLDGDHVVVEVVVPYVLPDQPEASDAEAHKIPIRIAEGFPVPVVARVKLPAYCPDEAPSFVRRVAREVYLHELDEQLYVAGRRPFAPEHDTTGPGTRGG